MAAPLEPPEPAGAAALRLPVAVQQNIGGSCTPTLQQMLVLAEREASAYKKELPSAESPCDNAQVGRWQAPRQQAAARTGASSLEECLKSKQHELARHREELASYEEAIQAGEQLWKDVQYVGQLAHFALCNFRKGKREIERRAPHTPATPPTCTCEEHGSPPAASSGGAYHRESTRVVGGHQCHAGEPGVDQNRAGLIA
ncbi:uncharacterized protein PG998_000762 [Apiospora kogelbergensis]|uniref:uncharacterized protein n=1 Tax=Apiospora kogelbergensis TaxID=1337665 RepID=UPI00312F660A